MLSQSETLSREEEDRHLRVEVEDCGVGMHPHEVKQLFGEMVQFDPSKLQGGRNMFCVSFRDPLFIKFLS